MSTVSQPSISIIIPVYNTEKLLARCLDSILVQTFEDFELLIVDDGSKDGSWDIIQHYQKLDSRIITFSKPNGGQGSARNLGLKNAAGKYILFVDSDDWIDDTTCEELFVVAEKQNADLIYFNYRLVYPNKDKNREITKIQSTKIWYDKEILHALFNDQITGHTCNKLYKREVIVRENLTFTNEKINHQDFLFCVEYFSVIHKVVYIPNSFYNYFMHSASATHSLDRRVLDLLKIIDEIKQYLIKKNLYGEYQSGVERVYSIRYVDILVKLLNTMPVNIEIIRELQKWEDQVKLKYLDQKYKSIFVLSRINISIALFYYKKIINGLYRSLIVKIK